jgi:hypothetical protein
MLTSREGLIYSMFMFFTFVGEVSPYAATPRCARVCAYPLRGDTPRRPVWFLAKHDFAAALGFLDDGLF